MLDDRVAGIPLFGGVQLASRESQLVDNADEGTRSHGGPDAQDSHADYPTSGLGDDNRRGRDIEQVAQEVGVRWPGNPIGAIMSHKADGGVEIGWSGAADVNLHEGPQRGNGRATRSGALLDDPIGGYHDSALNPQGGSAVSVHTRLYCAASPGAAMMPRT